MTGRLRCICKRVALWGGFDDAIRNGYYSFMKKASITQTKNQLSALIDLVRHGETVLIMDRGRAVARLEPMLPGNDPQAEGQLSQLERGGIIRRARAHPPKKFLQQPLPKVTGKASVLRALLAERSEGR